MFSSFGSGVQSANTGAGGILSPKERAGVRGNVKSD
jgi:hypothetical protein